MAMSAAAPIRVSPAIEASRVLRLPVATEVVAKLLAAVVLGADLDS